MTTCIEWARWQQLDAHTFNSVLEEFTNYTIQAVWEDGELEGWALTDPCGDVEGGAWPCWEDMLSDVVPVIERQEGFAEAADDYLPTKPNGLLAKVAAIANNRWFK
mgnify:CR=1 FL=1